MVKLSFNLTNIRQGLASQLGSISGLRTSHVKPESINPPVALVGTPSQIDYGQTFGVGTVHMVIPVEILVGRGDAPRAQDALDAYLNPTGAQSLVAAIHSDRTLGGVVDTLNVNQATRYGLYTYGDVAYLGATLLVEIWVS